MTCTTDRVNKKQQRKHCGEWIYLKGDYSDLEVVASLLEVCILIAGEPSFCPAEVVSLYKGGQTLSTW